MARSRPATDAGRDRGGEGRESAVLQLWLIALLAIVYIHDDLEGPGRAAGAVPFSWGGMASVLGPYVLLIAATHIVCNIAARQMDKRGSLRAVARAERMLAASRIVAVATHAAAVFSAEWLEQVREIIGDQRVLLSEFLAIVPPVLTIIAGWWWFLPHRAAAAGVDVGAGAG